MPIDSEIFREKIEEYKEIGHEYRYRDQLMVQEFSLSMVALGTLLNVILRPPQVPIAVLVLQVFGAAFLFLLSLHLQNINQDRRAALARKERLRQELGFAEIHGNVGGTLRFSAPRAMVGFTKIVAVVWTLWTLVFVFEQYQESRAAEKKFIPGELNYSSLRMGKCERPQDAEKLYAIARKLPTKTQQDAEFSSIVVEAICASDERLALEVFASIADPSLRDFATKNVIDKYVRDKKYDEASRWVQQLTNTQDRDRWIRWILESKRKDG